MNGTVVSWCELTEKEQEALITLFITDECGEHGAIVGYWPDTNDPIQTQEWLDTWECHVPFTLAITSELLPDITVRNRLMLMPDPPPVTEEQMIHGLSYQEAQRGAVARAPRMLSQRTPITLTEWVERDAIVAAAEKWRFHLLAEQIAPAKPPISQGDAEAKACEQDALNDIEEEDRQAFCRKIFVTLVRNLEEQPKVVPSLMSLPDAINDSSGTQCREALHDVVELLTMAGRHVCVECGRWMAGDSAPFFCGKCDDAD